MIDSSNLSANVALRASIQPSSVQLPATHFGSCVCAVCCSTSADFTSDGSVFEEDFTLQSDSFRWNQPGGKGTSLTITYSYTNLFNGGIQGGITNGEMKAAVEEAFKLWSNYAPLEFVEINDIGVKNRTKPNAADIRIGYEDLGGKGGTLGRTRLTYDGELATIISFDSRDHWQTDRTSTASDFLMVATHEIGHALGLRHELTSDAVMKPSAYDIYNGLGSAFLYSDDINGIRALYGEGTGSLTPRGGAVAPTNPGSNPGSNPGNNPGGAASSGASQAATVTGTHSSDILKGSSRNQIFRGRGGHDTIRAGGGDDTLMGGTGNDVLFGQAGRDRLIGVTTNSRPGLNERDVLLGGGQGDLFVLGDRNKVFYNDGRNNTVGHADYAFIKDFNAASGDRIQLKGNANRYRLGAAPPGTRRGKAIFLKTAGQDELIGIVKNNSGLRLQSSAFSFV